MKGQLVETLFSFILQAFSRVYIYYIPPVGVFRTTRFINKCF